MYRIEREKYTIGKMVDLYCRMHHGKSLCCECREIKDYAVSRLLDCSFKDAKPVCVNCNVHCYKPDMRLKVRDVMRFSGPRMIFRHPFLAVIHLIDKRIYKPESLKNI